MENNTNIEQDGLNIFEFLKVMIGYNKKGLIRLACVTVGVALVAFLILVFGYNRSKDYYVSEFNYLVETFDGDTYLDGTKFIALDLISEESLKKVKESNEQFNSIDIDAMLKQDDISIKRNEAPSMYAFTISVKKSCFQSSNQAAEFIKAIASIPQTTTNKMISQINNSGALTSYIEYDMTYEAKIDDLIAQTNVINSIYASLIEKYSDRNINEEFGEGVKISTLQTKASKMITNMHLDELKAVAESNYYVYDYESALPILENKLTNYNERLDVVSNKIKAISDEIDRQLASASNANVDGLNSQLAALLIEKEDLNHNITLVQNKITYGATTDTTEYDAKLTGYYNSVKELTDEAIRVQKYVLTYNQKVYFDSNNVVTRTGGLSTIISIIVSVVIGFVVALIVNLIFDLTPYKQYHLSKVRAAKEEKEVTENKDNE